MTVDLAKAFDRVRALRTDDRDPSDVVADLERIRREVNRAAGDRDPDPREPDAHHLYAVVRAALDLEHSRLTGETTPDGITASMLVDDFEQSRVPDDERRKAAADAHAASRAQWAAAFQANT